MLLGHPCVRVKHIGPVQGKDQRHQAQLLGEGEGLNAPAGSLLMIWPSRKANQVFVPHAPSVTGHGLQRAESKERHPRALPSQDLTSYGNLRPLLNTDWLSAKRSLLIHHHPPTSLHNIMTSFRITQQSHINRRFVYHLNTQPIKGNSRREMRHNQA